MPPRRIVSLVPSITETLFAFGLREEIVAITDYCTRPAEEVIAKERIGGTKTLKVKKILSLKPDLVIANVEENKRRQIEELIAAGINLYATFPRTVRAAIDSMGALAQITGRTALAERFLKPMDALCEQFKHRSYTVRPRVVCLIWKKPYMSFNADTYMNDLIETAGGSNPLASHKDRYCKITLDEMAAASPDFILLPTEPYAFNSNDAEDFQQLTDVPAVKNNRIYVVDGELLTWHGPRLLEGLLFLDRLFHHIRPDWAAATG